MRHFAILAAAVIGVAAIHGCSSCHSEVQVTSAPPPASSSAAVAEPPPEPVAVRGAQIEGTRVHIPHELDFAVDKATFDENKDPNKEILATLLEFMTKNTHVTKVRIEGHTDNTGKTARNMELSQQRADAVAKWLTGHGVDASRIKTVGLGDTKPEVPNDSDAHKAQNRRTEFHVEEIDGQPHVPRHRHGMDGGAPAPSASAASSAAPPAK
jgi:outer membrane protein OmpA-like peptidoglycan-associated protein